LRAADVALLAAARNDLAAAYALVLAPNARLHRDGHHPVTGASAISAALASEKSLLRARYFRGGVSSAGDLGWTFGPAELVVGPQAKSGSYTHVWKRDEAGRWRVVVAVLSPVRS
jgi:ketosteroid isomerase-like protein